MAHFSKTPKYRQGYVPDKDFLRADPYSLKIGVVTRVDPINMKADLRVITGGTERFEVDLTQSMAGPRSFLGGVPELNSLVVVGYRRIHKNLTDMCILGYIPSGNKSGLRFDPFSSYDPLDVVGEDPALVREVGGTIQRYKRLLLQPGDVGGMSSGGAEFVLSKDLTLTNRAGDSIELRDSDRTLVQQAIHFVVNMSGVSTVGGPIRRGGAWLPPDILTGRTLKSDGYFGADELQASGPGPTNTDYKWAKDGTLNPVFNDAKQFPPITLSSGKRVYYPLTTPGGSLTDEDSSGDAFVEQRTEIYHTTDLSMEVLEEIDGFDATRRTPYIEQVLGTLVGNDLGSTGGQRLYGKLLKPRIFSEFAGHRPGSFLLEEVPRPVTSPDIESLTTAGAYMLRIRPPRAVSDNQFAVVVQKQGKTYVNIPASTVEGYASGTKKISMEANLEGALKAYIGASVPDRISAHITLEGGLHLDVGRDAQGNAITTTFHSSTKTVYDGNPNQDDVTHAIQVRGVKELSVTGAENKTIEGNKTTVVSGQYQMKSDRLVQNSFAGFTGNYGESNITINGASQYNYAKKVTTTVTLEGTETAIKAGDRKLTMDAGNDQRDLSAGSWEANLKSGNYKVAVTTGNIDVTTNSGNVTLSTKGGNVTVEATGGSMSITTSTQMKLQASATMTLEAPMLYLGGSSASLGVLRASPAMPSGSPTLDPITGSPLQGSSTVFSN